MEWAKIFNRYRGWEVKPEGISEKITAGSEAAIAEADLVIFVVDAQVGALDEDQSLVDLLRRAVKSNSSRQ